MSTREEIQKLIDDLRKERDHFQVLYQKEVEESQKLAVTAGQWARERDQYESLFHKKTAELAEAKSTIRNAWAALNTTWEEAADDPDTRYLADSIKVSFQYERDKYSQLFEEFARVRKQYETCFNERETLEKLRHLGIKKVDI